MTVRPVTFWSPPTLPSVRLLCSPCLFRLPSPPCLRVLMLVHASVFAPDYELSTFIAAQLSNTTNVEV